MNGMETAAAAAIEEKRTFKEIVAFILSELKPRGKMFTPFNVISAPDHPFRRTPHCLSACKGPRRRDQSFPGIPLGDMDRI